MALSTLHLDSILKGNDISKRYYLGTYPSCLVSIPRRRRYSFITNTDNHSSSGGHWNAWFINDGTLYFLDTYGRSPYHETFPHDYRDILLKFEHVEYFKYRIQPFDTSTCGYYCIHFLLLLSLGLNLDDFKEYYSSDTYENDLIVINKIKLLVYTHVSFLQRYIKTPQ